MRLDELLTQCGGWSIFRSLEGLITAIVDGCIGKGKTLEDAITAALNAFASREKAKSPWVALLQAVDAGLDGWKWKAVDGGGKRACVCLADTIDEACGGVRPNPKVVTVGDLNSIALATSERSKLFVGGKPVVRIEVVDGNIELKTEE